MQTAISPINPLLRVKLDFPELFCHNFSTTVFISYRLIIAGRREKNAGEEGFINH